MTAPLRIMGLDPGTATTGYGVVDKIGASPKILTYGIISTSATLPMSERLLAIHAELDALLAEHQPDVVVMERLFFSKNQTTAIAVGKAAGVMQLAAAQRGISVVEYTPMEVKQAVVGYGAADKHQVQYMVQRILCTAEVPKPDDAADALALCVCHAHSEKLRSLAQ